jgi:hypothetical protein
MGTSLIGLLPQNTYSGLIKFGDNAALSASLKALSDGAGNDTMLSLSTTALQIGGATGLNWDDTNKRLGIGTTTPIGILHLKVAAGTTRMLLDGDAGQSKIITYRTGGLQRWGLYSNNVAESGSNAGSNFLLRRYSDAGTLLSTPFQVNRQTGQITIADGLDLAGSELKNFSADQNAGGALAITSANSATYNGTVYNVTGAVTISVDNTVPDGFSLTIIQQDANQCIVSAGTGLTLRNRRSHTKSAGQWGVISIIRTGSNLILGGDTA